MGFSKHMLLLDLETTGLSRERDHIISIGLTYLDKQDTPITTHWFLENPDEEQTLLERFITFIADYDTILSYYGKGFEFPFLMSRFQHYNIDTTPFLSLKLIDMKTTLKPFANKRSTLEALFHYQRKCQSTGHDIVKLYATYISSKADIYKSCILEHQKEELRSLLCFWELYDTLAHSSKWHIVNQSIDTKTLNLCFKRGTHPFQFSFHGQAGDFKISYTAGSDLLMLFIPIYEGTLKHYLEPLKDYYYIESQKQLLHKSLAQFMPTSLKRKATKEECIVTKSGIFLPIVTPYKTTTSIWYDTQGIPYIELSDFTADFLFNQLFYFFFKLTKKEGKA